MLGFIYKWTNTINGMWYIGSRKGTTNDGYIGSGKYFLRAVEKYGIENFTREILFEGDYVKDKIRSVKEAAYLQAENAANNPMSYNLSNISGPDCFDQATTEKMRAKRKGKTYEEIFGPEKAAKLKSLQRHLHSNKAYRKGYFGYKQSEEHIQKRAEKLRGRQQSEEHIQKRADALRAFHKNKKKGI